MVNELKKRECDINIKLTPSGTQYLHFEMNVAEDKFDYLPVLSILPDLYIGKFKKNFNV